MALYLSIVFVAMTIICVVNIFTYNLDAVWVIGAVAISVVVEIAISGLGSLLCSKSPESWFSPEKKLFKVSKKEQRFYEKIGIKSWKDRVLELGGLGGFRKNKINDASSPEYLHRFIMESNKGMVGHIINMFTGFLVVLILPLGFAWQIGVPVAIVGSVLNLLPILVLRYNLPKLKIAYKRASRLEARAKAEIIDSDQMEDEESVQGV